MSLKKLPRLPRTLAFRLTLWYAAIFSISSFVAFVAFSMLVMGVVSRRLDADLLSDVAELSSIYSSRDFEGLKTEIIREAASDGVDKVFLRVLSLEGNELASSDMASWKKPGVNEAALKQLAAGAAHFFETRSLSGKTHKVRIIYGLIAPGKIIQIGELQEDEMFVEALWEAFGAAMAVLILFAALIGWFMARRALAGLEEVTRTAEEISRGAMERRVPEKARGAEIEKLAITFNRMLDRIRDLIASIREMSDNIAHDLRSPITRIRGVAEMTLFTGKSISEYESMAASTIEECDQLLNMINTMLDISEAELGPNSLKMEKVDLTEMVRDACELFEPMAEDKGNVIRAEISGNCYVLGDVRKLQRMLANLLDNAVKYTPSGGVVTVSVGQDDKEAAVCVQDTGMGIPEDALSHVFERFYRCDRSRSQPGVGLGLSLVKATVKAHGGRVTAASQSGKGSVFCVTLPRLHMPH